MSRDKSGLNSALRLLLSVLVAIFGGFYTLIQDVSGWFIPQNIGQGWQTAARIGLASLIAVLIFCVAYYGSNAKRLLLRPFGFENIVQRWFSDSTEKRIHEGRLALVGFVSDNRCPVRIATVSGEWDICKPFQEEELRALLSSNKCEVQVLLAHPESVNLQRRCEAEIGQDLGLMKDRILHNTQKLLSVGQGKCKVRWYLGPPVFHLMSNSTTMHFSPFVDGISGHDTRRYAIDSRNPLYSTLIRWFDDTWEKAIDPVPEMKWVEKQIRLTQGVFLDHALLSIGNASGSSADLHPTLVLRPDWVEGLQLLSSRGFRLIVIGNHEPLQLSLDASSLAERDLAVESRAIKHAFRQHDLYIDAFYYCTHSIKQDCNCRLPKPQLFYRACWDFGLLLNESCFVTNPEAVTQIKNELPQMGVEVVSASTNFLHLAQNIAVREPD